jgi:uncharacterized repeat protein (TIGR03803 family)
VVFKLDTSNTFTVLHSFSGAGGSNGIGGPGGNLIEDSSGNLYGTTPFGGTTGAGVVFQISFVTAAGRN